MVMACQLLVASGGNCFMKDSGEIEEMVRFGYYIAKSKCFVIIQDRILRIAA
jgi:hypothetical protein